MHCFLKKIMVPIGLAISGLVLTLNMTAALANEDNTPDSTSTLSVGFINVDWYPFHFEKGNQIQGFAIDVVNAVLEQMRRDVDFQPAAFSVGLARLKSAELDAFFGLGKNLERIEQYHYSQDPLYLDETVLISRLNDSFTFNGDVSSLIGNRVGIIKGAIHGPAFDNMSEIIRVPHDSGKLRTAQFFHDLQKNKYRFIVVNSRSGAKHYIKKLGLQNQFKIHNEPVAIKSYYLVFSKGIVGLEKTTKRFDRIHRLFRSTKAYKALFQKYNLNQKLFPK